MNPIPMITRAGIAGLLAVATVACSTGGSTSGAAPTSASLSEATTTEATAPASPETPTTATTARPPTAVTTTTATIGADNRTSTEHEHEPAGTAAAVAPQVNAFLDAFRGYRSDYDAAMTRAELASMADVVLTGYLVGAREGRVIGEPNDPSRDEKLVLVFRVEKVVKGTLAESDVLVEVTKPELKPAAAYERVLPANAHAALYLSHVPVDEGVAPLPGAVPWVFTTPQGLLIDAGGSVIHPLDQSVEDNLFRSEVGVLKHFDQALPPG